MNQNVWGPHMWFTLHSITFNYPIKPTNDDKNNYKNFFIYLQNVIPCNICKKNYIRHLKEYPVDNNLNSRVDLVKWMINLHNAVNGETGKKILSYDNVIKKYEDAYQSRNLLSKDYNNDIIYTKNIYFNNNNIYYIILFIILVIILYIYFSNKIVIKFK
jgi:hypothetical protein